jgi:hypothetical protein
MIKFPFPSVMDTTLGSVPDDLLPVHLVTTNALIAARATGDRAVRLPRR